MTDFEWPWQYNFPPFYTLQPNLDTRRKQIDAWTSLVLAYHRHHRNCVMDVSESQSSPLFHNSSIDRRLTLDTIYIVLDELHKKGNIEWTDKTKRQCIVMWRTPNEWGSLIYKWAADRGLINSVCTLYELANGDDTVNEEFHGLDTNILLKSLKTLESQQKAEMISFNGSEGVKFF